MFIISLSVSTRMYSIVLLTTGTNIFVYDHTCTFETKYILKGHILFQRLYGRYTFCLVLLQVGSSSEDFILGENMIDI